MESDENYNDEWSEDKSSDSDLDSDLDITENRESEDDCSSDGETYYYMLPPSKNSVNTEVNMEVEESEGTNGERAEAVWIRDEIFRPLFSDYKPRQATFQIHQIDKNSTPFDVFAYFISNIEIQNVCEQSNLYVEQTQTLKSGSFKGFKPVHNNELYRFLALQLLMGLVHKPRIKDYWSTSPIYETPFFGKTMSRNRFEELLRAIHFCDNKGQDFKSNRMLKLGSIVPLLITKFASSIEPGRNLCIDESLTKFKGRLSFKQYMPKKRARFGVKLFILADCSTNLVLNAIPYQGETTQLVHPPTKTNDGLGYGGAVVYSLLDPYLDSNRIVFIDNWFNSPTLANLLTSRGTGVVGTVRRHRKGMPTFENKLKKGEVESYTNAAYLVERWQDRREVVMLNNCIPHQMVNLTKPNEKEKIKPASVLAYNKSMGAVDELDKILQPYAAQRKTIKWYKKLWFHHIDMVVYNSRIVYNSFRSAKEKLPYKMFLESLIQEMILCNPVDKLPIGRPVNTAASETRLQGRNHFPVKMFHRDSDGKVNDKPLNRRCYLCNLKTVRHEGPYACGVCKVHLCITRDKSCFEEYHTSRKLPIKKCFKKALVDRSHYL